MMAYFEDNKSYADLVDKMFNDYFDSLIKESARTEVLENTKEYTKDEIENLLDIAIKMLSGDEVL